MAQSSFLILLLLCVSVLGALLRCPYTKVEESFHIQAIHDFLYAANTSTFDHLAFPGVVPRSFALSWAVSLFTVAVWMVCQGGREVLSAAHIISSTSHLGTLSPMQLCTIARLGIAALNVLAITKVYQRLCVLEGTVKSSLTGTNPKRRSAGNIFLLLCASQFHVVFYASRSLPNSFAFAPCTLALAFLLEDRYEACIAVLTCTAAVIRCDMVLLTGLVGLCCVGHRQWALVLSAAVTGLLTLIIALLVTIPLDSMLWLPSGEGGRLSFVWPEGSVLWFNTYENQSSLWGTYPCWWYVGNALPRAFMLWTPLMYGLGGLALVPSPMQRWAGIQYPCGGFISTALRAAREYRSVLFCSWGFVFLYSALPHKELRFILPVFPWFFAPLAALCARWIQQVESVYPNRHYLAHGAYVLFYSGILCVLFFSVLSTVISMEVSRANYPGSEALEEAEKVMLADIHQRTLSNATLTLFLDAHALMTGINRFQKTYLPEHQLTLDGALSSTAAFAGFFALSRRGFRIFWMPFAASQAFLSMQRLSDGAIPWSYSLDTTSSCGDHLTSPSPVPPIRYVKDASLFVSASEAEAFGLSPMYEPRGIDYAIVRASQRELHLTELSSFELVAEFTNRSGAAKRKIISSVMHAALPLLPSFLKASASRVLVRSEAASSDTHPFVLLLRKKQS